VIFPLLIAGSAGPPCGVCRRSSGGCRTGPAVALAVVHLNGSPHRARAANPSSDTQPSNAALGTPAHSHAGRAFCCLGRVDGDRARLLKCWVLALTVRQPHASAIFLLGKDVENRTWPTSHRGLLVVHAGVAVDEQAMARMGNALNSPLPLGHIVGVVELQDCVVLKRRTRWALRDHFHWLLERPRLLSEPVPCRGQQGLWGVPADVAGRVSEQLREC
jgi:hypothetical protein